jgi:hypothetical protein
MRKITTLLMLCVAMVLSAQEVDKATVTAQADAAKAAVGDLSKLTVGEESPWKCTGVIGLNASATGLVNWAAGGKNNVNGVAFANIRLLYKKNRMAWDTNLDTDLGYSWIDQDEDPLQKTNDKIVFTTKFGYEFAKSWYATAVGSFRSSYLYGYEYATGENPIMSKWLAPSYTDLSVGIDWKPNDIFSVYLSPVAGRITTAYVANNDSLADVLKLKYGVTDAEGNPSKANFKAEMGLTFKGSVNYTLVKNLKILSTVSLFTPYNQKFGNFDVDWDVSISYQFLKVLNVSLGTSLKYYDSVMIADKNGENAKQRVQFKSVLGLGIGYSF